jgi:hypothetical protein
MQTIFGNTMATGKFAKDSNAALGEDDEVDNEEVMAHAFTKRMSNCDDNATTSSTSKIRKKAKKRDSEEEGLIAAFKSVGDTLSSAIEKVATGDTDVPDDLFDSLINLPGVCALFLTLNVVTCFLLICLSNKNYCNLKPENYCNIFFDNLLNFAGFEQTHISLYFNYLVAHPHIARAFNKLPFDHKLIWARNFVSEKFPGV